MKIRNKSILKEEIFEDEKEKPPYKPYEYEKFYGFYSAQHDEICGHTIHLEYSEPYPPYQEFIKLKKLRVTLISAIDEIPAEYNEKYSDIISLGLIGTQLSDNTIKLSEEIKC